MFSKGELLYFCNCNQFHLHGNYSSYTLNPTTQALRCNPALCFTMRMTTKLSHLLIVLKLIVQDDSVGLVGLRPGQGDAVHGAADLVHDGHSGRSCKKKKKTHGVLKGPSTDNSQRLDTFGAASRHKASIPAPGAEPPGTPLPPSLSAAILTIHLWLSSG